MITSAEKVYIKNFMTEFETALRSPYYKDSTKGYRNYISTKSFIDYMVMQELSKNIDGYRLSTYMYKTRDKADKKGLLHMGPIWDLNLAYGYSASLCSGNWKDIGWAYNYNTNCPSDQWFVPFWYDRLLQDPAFRDELKTRWDILRKGPLQTDSLMNNIDTLIKQMGPARIRNFKIWDNVFLVQIWPGNQVANSYEGEIEYFKNFIRKRLIWLDTNIPDVHAEVTYNDIESPLSLDEIGQVRIYPNPFTDQLKIDYIVSDPTIVRLSIFNFMGQKIITMENMSSANEINSFTWNGTNENGALVKPGIYLYTLELKNSVVVRGKLIKK